MLHLWFNIAFDIRSAQECGLPGDGAPRCPLHHPGPGAGAVVLPSQQFLRPQPWRSGTIWEQALGPTHRGHAGRLVPLQGQRIPALHLLLLHPFPASAPRVSLCCSRGLGSPCLWVGRHPCSYTLTYIWPHICLAWHALPSGCCPARCLSQHGWLVRNYLHTGYRCVPGAYFLQIQIFTPGREFPPLPVGLRGLGGSRSLCHSAPEESERWQGLKVSRRTSQLFCVIHEELALVRVPAESNETGTRLREERKWGKKRKRKRGKKPSKAHAVCTEAEVTGLTAAGR